MGPEKKQRKKPTGRKKKLAAEVKNVRHTIRFTENENEELQSVVKTLGTTVGDFLRSKGLGVKNQVVNGANLIASLDKIGGELGWAGPATTSTSLPNMPMRQTKRGRLTNL